MTVAIGKVGDEPRFVETPDDDELAMHIEPGEVHFPVEGVPTRRVSIDTDPAGGYRLVPYRHSLVEMRTWFWEQTKLRRTAIMQGGFASSFGPLDSTDVSQMRLAMFAGQGQPVTWTMADGSSRDLTAADLVTLNAEMLAFVNDCHHAGIAIREEIDAANSQAALEAIDLVKGYPATAIVKDIR